MFKELVAGGVGGSCLVLVGHPFDLVKVRIQTASVAPGQAAPSIMSVVRNTLAKEGFQGLYRGMSAPLAGVTPIFAICFWAYEVGKQLMRSVSNVATDNELSIFQLGIAGAFSAIPTTAIMAPGERIKVLLQVQNAAAPQFKGPVDVVKHLYSTGGVRSIFRGSAATLLRDGIGSFAYFGLYEYLKRSLHKDGKKPSTLSILFAGGMAGIANWVVAIPFDVIKSRIQAQAGSGSSSMVAVGRQLIASEGVGALYKGVGPALLRAFPANAACFFGVELTRSIFDQMM